MAKRNEQNLSSLRAICHALLARDIEYFPRLSSGKGVETLGSEAILKEAYENTSNIEEIITGKHLEEALVRGRESLDEVKAITEYQDQKATRLLTVISFLSALSGILFGRFAQEYPMQETIYMSNFSVVLVAASYFVFIVFVLSAVSGALVIFHATRTRFKFPEPDPSNAERELKAPNSHLFFPAIIAVRPSAWAASFAAPTSTSRGVHSEANLSTSYLRNYIAESYLIAAKVADKVRYLEPAQNILSFSLRCLLIWLVLFGVVHTFVEPTPRSGVPLPPLEKAPLTRQSTDSLPPYPTATPEGITQEDSNDGAQEPEEKR